MCAMDLPTSLIYIRYGHRFNFDGCGYDVGFGVDDFDGVINLRRMLLRPEVSSTIEIHIAEYVYNRDA